MPESGTKNPLVATAPLSRTALRALRLKPAQGQPPAMTVWSHKARANIELFDPAACVPMGPRRVPTPAQREALRAGRLQLTHVACGCGALIPRAAARFCRGLCPACAQREEDLEDAAMDLARRQRLAELLSAHAGVGTLYLDTETTGLSSEDELLEIALVDDNNAVRFHSLIRPSRHATWPEAERLHGITPAMVAEAPMIEDLVPPITDAIGMHAQIVAYNAAFDLSYLPPAIAGGLHARARCAMEAFALYVGDYSEYHRNYRWQPLADAARWAGFQWPAQAHRAVADAQAVRAVWTQLVQRHHVEDLPQRPTLPSTEVP